MEPLSNQLEQVMGISITVKNIPEKLYEKLKTRAEAHRRSVNSEIILILEESLFLRRLKPEEVLARARALRARTRGAAITGEFVNQAKREGRL